jgi:hypothetical protein
MYNIDCIIPLAELALLFFLQERKKVEKGGPFLMV